ncbi:MAG: hypothetical protein IKJ89_03440, partial [Kiritimatiellae bacterium]|nr:hypothetical protein [Kiritimatiellia bacterium]
MTTLKIIPDFKNKTAECIGYPSAGEHVEVCIVGGASLLPSSTLRFRVKFGRVTLALFPRPEVNETWETEGADLKCHLNLNTIQARSVCRTGNTVCHAILDQVGDDEHTVEPTLFFDDLFDVTPWYREPGADEPYDLDIYPNQIADLNQRVNAIGAKVAEAKNAAETAAGSANAAYESAQSAVEAAQTANARANSAESAARAAAVSAGRAEGALERIGSQVEEARNAATRAMASASSASNSAAAAEENADAAAESAESAASSASEAVSTVQEHAERDDNPHVVTKAQIGLGSVDNTSDMNKPVSHAQRRALELKQDCLSAAQIVAINSGIDQQKVAQIALNLSAISAEIARATSAEAVLRGAIAAIGVMDVVLADELPAAGEQYQRKLYLIPSTNPETRNVKDEFICVKIEDVWSWEHVGSTAITIEFDDEPTEGSQKAARSGGIWAWVKRLVTGNLAANPPIAAGTKCKIAYDAKGLVVNGQNLAEGDIPQIPTSKLSDFGTKVRYEHYEDNTSTIVQLQDRSINNVSLHAMPYIGDWHWSDGGDSDHGQPFWDPGFNRWDLPLSSDLVNKQNLYVLDTSYDRPGENSDSVTVYFTDNLQGSGIDLLRYVAYGEISLIGPDGNPYTDGSYAYVDFYYGGVNGTISYGPNSFYATYFAPYRPPSDVRNPSVVDNGTKLRLEIDKDGGGTYQTVDLLILSDDGTDILYAGYDSSGDLI